MSNYPFRTPPSPAIDPPEGVHERAGASVDAPTVPAMAPVVPAISVCIAVRDRPELLVKSIRSALSGTFQNFEVVVVDDGSTTPVRGALVEAGLLADSRVRLMSQAPSGISAARNAALRAARGRIITVLDSDDELTTDGLARIDEFVGRTGAAWVYTDYEELTGGTRRVIRLPGYPSPRRMLWSVLVRPRLPFKHSGMSIDRDLLLELGGYDERMPIKVDVELVLRALSKGVHPRRLPYPVVRFHRHDSNISRRRLAGLVAWRKMIRTYRPARVPGLALVLVAVRAVSEIGKWLVTAAGR